MPGTAEGHCWTVEGRSWGWALEVGAEATHWPLGSLEEEVGGSRTPAHPPPEGVVVGEWRGLMDQISARP